MDFKKKSPSKLEEEERIVMLRTFWTILFATVCRLPVSITSTFGDFVCLFLSFFLFRNQKRGIFSAHELRRLLRPMQATAVTIVFFSCDTVHDDCIRFTYSWLIQQSGQIEATIYSDVQWRYVLMQPRPQ